MTQDMFSPPVPNGPVTVQEMLPPVGAAAWDAIQNAKPYVPMQRLGFWPQVGKYIERGTHESLAKYFGIADKLGATTALTEPEFNHIKGERPMLFRPGFSRKTWENEIDAHDVGKVVEGLEINGIDNTFAMIVGSVLGGFTDPVNVAGTYLAPMVGAMAIGANALSRGAVAHILKTEGPEALVKFLSANPTGYFQQVKRAAIFGAAEGAMEIPADKYLSELTGQRTYTAADAGLNILTGAALNATIAGVDPVVSGTMRAVQAKMSKLNRNANQFAVQIAAKGLNDGTPISVSDAEANIAKMDTYQASAKTQTNRTDGKKATTPERATPPVRQVKLDVPDVVHNSGAPLDFKGDDVSKALYATAGGNKDVEDQLMRALIDNGTFHADVPSTREALQQAAAEIKTKVDAQAPSVKPADGPARLPKDLQGAKPRYQSFETRFESDVDKALFVVSKTKKSKRDADYRAFLTKQGLSDAEIEAGSVRVRAALKEASVANEGASLLDIPTLHAGKADASPIAPSKPVRVRVDGIPTLARIRDKVVPKAAVLQAATPEAQAMVDHTIRPSDHDLLVGQDYKAASVAAIDGETNQMLKDLKEYTDMTDEEIADLAAKANKSADITNAVSKCAWRPVGSE